MKILFLIVLIIISNFKIKYSQAIRYSEYIYNGIYSIRSLLNNLYFSFNKDILILSSNNVNFRLANIESNKFFIELINKNKKLGLDENERIKLYSSKENVLKTKLYWNIIKIIDSLYIIQNEFNQKYIEVYNNNFLQCSNNITFILENKNFILNNSKMFVFSFFKLYEEDNLNKKYLKIIQKEPIDIVIKYIDLKDKSLNRTGIKQIYKDIDNDELKYSVRSILQNIPWIRKIFILMPNEKVKFFKSPEEINEKMIYIKDKDFLGFDCANNPSFSFHLFKMQKFGVSKNFIYMDDDYFIGKPLKKIDFFYYEENEKKVNPYILTSKFYEMNKTDILIKYNELKEKKRLFNAHSGNGFWLQHLSTLKFFIDNYKLHLINTEFTHNALGENIDDLKEIYEEAQKYEFINETLFSIERFILSLVHQVFYNLYQLNIKHKKVNTIPWRYISIEKIKKVKLNKALFVLNTGGNHIPSKRQTKILKKIMEKRFPYQVKYEIIGNKKKFVIKRIRKCFPKS